MRDHLKLTADIVSAYVAKSPVRVDDVPGLIRSVRAALIQAESGADAQAIQDARPVPAVPIKKSVFADYIVCLEDGKKLKTLKRHLRAFDLTPEQYRAKWGLPDNYPMVASNYAARRSELAKTIGLGRGAARGPTITHVPEGKRGIKRAKQPRVEPQQTSEAAE